MSYLRGQRGWGEVLFMAMYAIGALSLIVLLIEVSEEANVEKSVERIHAYYEGELIESVEKGGQGSSYDYKVEFMSGEVTYVVIKCKTVEDEDGEETRECEVEELVGKQGGEESENGVVVEEKEDDDGDNEETGNLVEDEGKE